VTDSRRPTVVSGRHSWRQQGQGRWSAERWRMLLLAACAAAVTVAVPPLLGPQRERNPSAGHVPAPVGTPSAGPANSPTPSADAPAASGSTPTHFTPIILGAQDSGNLLTGGAAVVACSTCDGGYRVRYLCASCQLVLRTTLPVSGQRTVTVVYEADGTRKIKVSVNGAPPIVRTVSGPNWATPEKFDFTATLPAGTLVLTFYNDESPAPDINKVVIS
jgi:hypothetical protein